MNENISLLQESDLLLIRDQLNDTLKTLGVKKERAKAISKIIFTLICTGGRIATAILIPGPLTFAILGGLGFLFTRNCKSLNKISKKKEEKKMLKSKLEEINKRLA